MTLSMLLHEAVKRTSSPLLMITHSMFIPQYVYTYLLHERSKFVDVLKVFTDKMERRLDRKVKVVRSDRGGELYGKLLQSRGICAQHSMSNTL